MKKVIIYFVVSLCLFSCRSYQAAWLKPENPLPKKIPNMDIFVDTINIENEMQYIRYYSSFSNHLPIIRFNDPVRHVKSQSDDLTMLNWSRKIPNDWYYEQDIQGNYPKLFNSISTGDNLKKYKEIPLRMAKFNEIPWGKNNLPPWQLGTIEGNLYFYRQYSEKFNIKLDTIKLFEYLKLFPEIFPSNYFSEGSTNQQIMNGTLILDRKTNTKNNFITIEDKIYLKADKGIKYPQPTPYLIVGELKNSIKKYPDFYWYKDSAFVQSVYLKNDEDVMLLGYKAKDYMYSVGDALDLFNNYFKDNIIDTSSIPVGRIDIKIKKIKHKFNGLWTVSSLLTVATINLLGFPLGSQSCSINVNATIKNKNGDIIKEYNEIGKGTAYSAPYWGYRWLLGMVTKDDGYISNLARVANTFAINDALKKIRADIAKDNEVVSNALK